MKDARNSQQDSMPLAAPIDPKTQNFMTTVTPQGHASEEERPHDGESNV
jgi:hypothetical protein